MALGVMLTHDNIVSNIEALSELFTGHYTKDDVHLSFLPWAHAYGHTVELFTAIAHGASLGLVSHNDRIIEEMVMVKPTILVSVPKLFEKVFAGVESQVNKGSYLKYAAFQAAMSAARTRRDHLDAGEDM